MIKHKNNFTAQGKLKYLSQQQRLESKPKSVKPGLNPLLKGKNKKETFQNILSQKSILREHKKKVHLNLKKKENIHTKILKR